MKLGIRYIKAYIACTKIDKDIVHSMLGCLDDPSTDICDIDMVIATLESALFDDSVG